MAKNKISLDQELLPFDSAENFTKRTIDPAGAKYILQPHIGIDEAGRGCLAGPVVAAALYSLSDIDLKSQMPELDDSKKLTAKKRDEIFLRLNQIDTVYGIGFSWPSEIDRVNILNATFRAMARASFNCYQKIMSIKDSPDLKNIPLLIDGSHEILAPQWIAGWMNEYPLTKAEKDIIKELDLALPVAMRIDLCPSLPKQVPVIDGDSLIPSISGASIIAKTMRDSVMCKLHEIFPNYGFAKHKGYGTRVHFEAIEMQGESILHRKTFIRKKNDRASLFDDF